MKEGNMIIFLGICYNVSFIAQKDGNMFYGLQSLYSPKVNIQTHKESFIWGHKDLDSF